MDYVDFDSLAQKLAPTLQVLENKRKELLRKGRSEGLIYAAVFLVVGVITLLILKLEGIFGPIVIVVISVIIFITCINNKSKIFSSFYKEEVVNEIIHAFCSNATYSPNDGVGEDLFKNSGLFTSPDRYHAEDLIEGCLGKTSFICSEVHAEERKARSTKNGVQYYWEDIFKGFLFIADFHKDFQGETTVLRDSFFKIKMGASRVKMESPDFEKVFDVFSTNQIEARYLITPSMMERMLKLDSNFKKGITISFRNSTILVAIPDSKNRFEADVWSSLNDMSILKSDFAVLQSLLEIVDELNLNTRIWSKE
ncbi:DUF3137 domain-containing protein [Bacteroides intestinalis]|uniref:DUF3137 domain-containing protein n=1 Tax=Bacteroides intestinalis TaxID=329854 RepID=UPI000E5422A8|nr:DUF3137 domain-containing protein [Bacteroides intestinalis]RGX86432.1 DUF3137 domain-containing protein [Bacteroides intestinalis]